MKKLLALLSLLCFAGVVPAQQKEPKLFTYEYAIDDLDNGLRLVTVPTDFPNMIAVYIVVQTGSRNEVEPGKSGYAHLFEHIMFRGSENYTPEQRDLILKKAGAESNATTNSDRTTYYEIFSKEDLEAVMKLEADRFQRLKYPEPSYKTESLAVRSYKRTDRKSTRLNSSHLVISYAVFCLKKKKNRSAAGRTIRNYILIVDKL